MKPNVKFVPGIVTLILFTAFVFGILSACAHLVPGADPIVVRAEQIEVGAKDTLTLVVSTDDSNRAFWMTNAPAFHNFCEWLREPQKVDGTNTLPRGLAIVKNLDNVKVAYKTAKTSSNSNLLVTAIGTASSVLTQASAWLTIASNSPAR